MEKIDTCSIWQVCILPSGWVVISLAMTSKVLKFLKPCKYLGSPLPILQSVLDLLDLDFICEQVLAFDEVLMNIFNNYVPIEYNSFDD